MMQSGPEIGSPVADDVRSLKVAGDDARSLKVVGDDVRSRSGAF